MLFFAVRKKSIMDSFDKYISRNLPLVSLISAVFIIYPNIACTPWELNSLEPSEYLGFFSYFIYRFLFFWGMIGFLINYNLRQIPDSAVQETPDSQLPVCTDRLSVLRIRFVHHLFAWFPYGFSGKHFNLPVLHALLFMHFGRIHLHALYPAKRKRTGNRTSPF